MFFALRSLLCDGEDHPDGRKLHRVMTTMIEVNLECFELF